MPKIELHLHLEGSMRSETVRRLSLERLGWTGELEANWERSYYTYTDFAGFMAQLTPRFPGNAEEYRRIATECFEDLAEQGVVYAEVSIGLPVSTPGDDRRFWPVMEAVEEERRRAEASRPIKINLIGGLMRSLPVEVAVYGVQLAAQARDRGIGLVAIDLHGDEINFPPAPFLPAFRLAEESGLQRRAHAGEAAGPQSIWDAIEVLGVRRIGHGVRAVEDPALLERLRTGDVVLELCPTSNVRTAAVPNLQEHPIRLFRELGIPVTVSSDDPLPFFTDIDREYRLLVDELGFDLAGLREITLTAALTAFLPDDERRTLISLIDGAYRSASRTTSAGPIPQPTT